MDISDIPWDQEPEERIERLLREVDEIRELNTGASSDHKHPKLVAWHARASAVVADKVGEDSHLFKMISTLQFWGFDSVDETPPDRLKEFFDEHLGRAIGVLEATYEAAAKPGPPRAPLVEVHQRQEGASANATSTATVDVTISVSDLKACDCLCGGTHI